MENTPELGPAGRTSQDTGRVPLDAARARVLAAVQAAGANGATTGSVATAVDAHVNTARHHLTQLLADELIEPIPSRVPLTRGRPATYYRVTTAGQEALGVGARGGDEYVQLAAGLIERLAKVDDDPRESALLVGRSWGSNLALAHGPADARRWHLQGTLARLGFSPVECIEIEEEMEEESEALVLDFQTCPLLNSARLHPEVVCQVHLGLVQAIVGQVEGVALEPFARPGACTAHVSFQGS